MNPTAEEPDTTTPVEPQQAFTPTSPSLDSSPEGDEAAMETINTLESEDSSSVSEPEVVAQTTMPTPTTPFQAGAAPEATPASDTPAETPDFAAPDQSTGSPVPPTVVVPAAPKKSSRKLVVILAIAIVVIAGVAIGYLTFQSM